jgi:hypothetical protein
MATLLAAVMLAMGELGARLFGDNKMPTFFAYFAVAFGVWTYVFYYDGQYRILDRTRRALLSIALLTIGFGLVWLLYPQSGSLLGHFVIFAFLSLPLVTETVLGHPLGRKRRK